MCVMDGILGLGHIYWSKKVIESRKPKKDTQYEVIRSLIRIVLNIQNVIRMGLIIPNVVGLGLITPNVTMTSNIYEAV